MCWMPGMSYGMDETLGLLNEFAIVLAFALIGGYGASRLKIPPIVGYIAAGIAVGPFTPGFVANVSVAEQMGEIGIVILMFGVGLHFSVRDLLAVKNVAIPGAIIQSMVTTALGIGVALAFGWSFGEGLVLGLALSVASTVVLMRELMARNVLDTRNGRIAAGWLIVEDMFSVLVLVLLPIVAASLGGSAAGTRDRNETLMKALLHQGDSVLSYGLGSLGLDEGPLEITAIALINVGLLAVMILFVGKRLVSMMLDSVESLESKELFTLATLVVALFIAVVAKAVFGLSDALGAFLAGVMVGDYRLSHRVAEDIRPMRDVFGIIFFAAVGMLLDPQAIVHAPVQMLVVVTIIMAAKPLIAAVILKSLRQSTSTVAMISPALGQVGEFSFILAVLGRTLNLLPEQGYQLIISGSIISIALNSLLFNLAERLTGAIPDPQPPLATELSRS
jgi:CPA2 family monovalent cation:H+ antiporter-2